MRRLALAFALLLAAPPVTAQTPAPFACDEVALDMAACGSPPDLALCPTLCTDPANPTPETCAALPLPELPTLDRTSPAQGILRQAFVTGGSYVGATLSLVSLNASADAVFAKARDQLCKAPASPTPPAPAPPPTGGDDDSPPVVVIGGGLIGPNPGLVGPNPGLVGVTPRFR
jgi:hypothetical protein